MYQVHQFCKAIHNNGYKRRMIASENFKLLYSTNIYCILCIPLTIRLNKYTKITP